MNGENQSPQTVREHRTKNRILSSAMNGHSILSSFTRSTTRTCTVVLSEADTRNEMIGSPVRMYSLKYSLRNDHT